MKLKIAICENNKHDFEFLMECLLLLDCEFQYEWIESADRLLEIYTAGVRFDFAFMEVDFPGINGFEASVYLHDRYPTQCPLIIFLTRSDRYVYDAYPYALAYVKKPMALEKLKEIFECVISELAHNKIAIETSKGITCFNVKDIIFFEASYGAVRIFLEQDEYCAKTLLSTIYTSKLPCKSKTCS